MESTRKQLCKSIAVGGGTGLFAYAVLTPRERWSSWDAFKNFVVGALRFLEKS